MVLISLIFPNGWHFCWHSHEHCGLHNFEKAQTSSDEDLMYAIMHMVSLEQCISIHQILSNDLKLHYINCNIQGSRIQQPSTMCCWFDLLILPVLPALVNDYIHHKVWDELFIHSQTLIVQLWMFENRYIIPSHTLLDMWLWYQQLHQSSQYDVSMANNSCQGCYHDNRAPFY